MLLPTARFCLLDIKAAVASVPRGADVPPVQGRGLSLPHAIFLSNSGNAWTRCI